MYICMCIHTSSHMSNSFSVFNINTNIRFKSSLNGYISSSLVRVIANFITVSIKERMDIASIKEANQTSGSLPHA